MAAISLTILICAILFGIIRKINVGVVAIGFSIILALIAGIPLKQVYQGFPTQLFLTLLGTMFFFSLLEANGTLTALSNFVVKLIGKRLFLLPIVVYLFAFTLSAVGPGAIPVLPIAIIIAVNLAKELKLSPVLMGGLATLGSVGGTLSPMALTGIIVQGILSEHGLPGMSDSLFVVGAFVNFIFAVILYLFYKGYSITLTDGLQTATFEKFTTAQKLSIAMLTLLIILVIGFKLDVGLVAFALSIIMLATRAGNEKAGITRIPWGVIIMVCGVNVLMTLTQKLGGVKLLASALSTFMNEFTAPPIMALTGGIMSQFSSANGVVIPTLVPTTIDIVADLGGNASVYELTFAITVAAVLTLSPLSTAGALIMASYTQGDERNTKEANKLFTTLFIWTFVILILFALMCMASVYRLY